MSAQEANPIHKQKKFQGKDRTIPHHSQKASRWYPAEDTKAPRKVRPLDLECYSLHLSQQNCAPCCPDKSALRITCFIVPHFIEFLLTAPAGAQNNSSF